MLTNWHKHAFNRIPETCLNIANKNIIWKYIFLTSTPRGILSKLMNWNNNSNKSYRKFITRNELTLRMNSISAAFLRVRFFSSFATSKSGSLDFNQRTFNFLLGFVGRSSNISITAGWALTGRGIPDIIKEYCPTIDTISLTFLAESNSTKAHCGRLLGPK